jgi:hypothetical protein
MNLVRKIESILKPWLIVLFVILLFVFGLYRESKADEALIEIGPTFLSGELAEGAMLAFHQEWDRRWSLGMGYISRQVVEDRSGTVFKPDPNLFVQGQRLVYVTDNLSVGLGVAYFNSTNRALGTNFAAQLALRYEFGRTYLAIRHWSNAGSGSPNMGQDVLVIGYRF